MKQMHAKGASTILNRIASIEKEVSDLKLSILKDIAPSKKNIVSLRGIIKKVSITEKEIDAAKKSLFSGQEI